MMIKTQLITSFVSWRKHLCVFLSTIIIRVHMYTYTHTSAYTRTHTHTFAYTRTHTHAFAYTRTHTHIFAYTRTHTYAHTCPSTTFEQTAPVSSYSISLELIQIKSELFLWKYCHVYKGDFFGIYKWFWIYCINSHVTMSTWCC